MLSSGSTSSFFFIDLSDRNSAWVTWDMVDEHDDVTANEHGEGGGEKDKEVAILNEHGPAHATLKVLTPRE